MIMRLTAINLVRREETRVEELVMVEVSKQYSSKFPHFQGVFFRNLACGWIRRRAHFLSKNLSTDKIFSAKMGCESSSNAAVESCDPFNGCFWFP